MKSIRDILLAVKAIGLAIAMIPILFWLECKQSIRRIVQSHKERSHA